jgi:hypothetical protein
MKLAIEDLKNRIEYWQQDLKEIHDEASTIFIRGQIAGLKEALKLLEGRA